MRPPSFCPQCATALSEREDGGRKRLACLKPHCGYIFYGNPIPVVAALVEHEGNIILIRNKGWPEKFFGLVSGFLEADEEPADGVLRELKEELGLDGTVESLIGVYTFTMRNEIIMAYHVKARGQIVVGDELGGYKAVRPDKLRAWPMGTGKAVTDWLRQRGITTE